MIRRGKIQEASKREKLNTIIEMMFCSRQHFQRFKLNFQAAPYLRPSLDVADDVVRLATTGSALTLPSLACPKQLVMKPRDRSHVEGLPREVCWTPHILSLFV
jgi:hypothetical protein